MKRTLKTGLCLLLSLLTALYLPVSVLSASAEETFVYPQGLTGQRVKEMIPALDNTISTAVQKFSGKSLTTTVTDALWQSDLLGTVTVAVYSALSDSEYEQLLSLFRLSTAPSDIAAVLYNYPEVAAKLKSASSWDGLSLEGISWGTVNKTEFAAAFGTVLSPLDTLLNFLLCEGSINLFGTALRYSGENGYETGIIPVYEALGCKNYLSYADYKKQAESNATATGANLILPILTFLEESLSAPVDTLTKQLPGFAYFLQNDGIQKTMDALMTPITKITDILGNIPLLNTVLSTAGFSMTSDLSGNLVPDLEGMLADSDLPFDLSEIDWALLAGCGTVSGNTVAADQAKTFVTVFRWLWNNLKGNTDTVSGLFSDSDTVTDETMKSVLDELMKDDADTVLCSLAFLLAPDSEPSDLYWTYSDISPKAYPFGTDMTREKYAEMEDGMDSMLAALVADMQGAASMKEAVAAMLYTNDTITALVKGIYGAVGGEELQGILSLLEVEAGITDVTAALTEDCYAQTRAMLNRCTSWENLPDEGMTWGFTDGSREGFVQAFAAVLRPLNGILSFLLAGSPYTFLGSVTLNGGAGYNNAVIPVFEALGTDTDDYKTYADYAAGAKTDAVLTDILDPVLDTLEKLCDSPVGYLCTQLPALCYFISDGGIEQCLFALLSPVFTVLTDSGLSVDTQSLLEKLSGIDLSFGDEQLRSLLNKLKENGTLSVALPDMIPLADMGSLGTILEVTSKRTLNGKTATYKTVVADRESVLAYIVDFLVGFMQMPENAGLLTGSLAASGEDGAENPFASYTDSFTGELSGMTHAEMVAWFYDLLHTEPVQEEETTAETVIPSIIYEEKKDSSLPYVLAASAVLVLVAGVVLFVLFRKRKSSGNPETKEEKPEKVKKEKKKPSHKHKKKDREA